MELSRGAVGQMLTLPPPTPLLNQSAFQSRSGRCADSEVEKAFVLDQRLGTGSSRRIRQQADDVPFQFLIGWYADSILHAPFFQRLIARFVRLDAQKGVSHISNARP